MASISGTVTVAGDPDDWIACAFDADTNAYAGSAAVSAGTYEITGLTTGKAYMVACRCKTGGVWQATYNQYIYNDLIIPKNPITTPYIYKLTSPSGEYVRSARYWKTKQFITNYNQLTLSELQLHNNDGNKNPSATITGTTPSSGSISNIADNNLTTEAYWSGPLTNVYIKWDFGISTNISHVKIGCGSSENYFPTELTVEYSNDDINWSTQAILTNIAYPGDGFYTDLISLQSLPSTGSTEPTWPTTIGTTVVDSDITWTNIGRLVSPLLQGPLIAA